MSRYIDATKLTKDGWSLQRTKHSLTSSTYEVMELDCVPTADVRENVRGEWIIKDDIVPINFMDGYVETERCVCSNCGYEPTYAGRTIFPTTRTLLFCPNCGADMRGENE